MLSIYQILKLFPEVEVVALTSMKTMDTDAANSIKGVKSITSSISASRQLAEIHCIRIDLLFLY